MPDRPRLKGLESGEFVVLIVTAMEFERNPNGFCSLCRWTLRMQPRWRLRCEGRIWWCTRRGHSSAR